MQCVPVRGEVTEARRHFRHRSCRVMLLTRTQGINRTQRPLSFIGFAHAEAISRCRELLGRIDSCVAIRRSQTLLLLAQRGQLIVPVG